MKGAIRRLIPLMAILGCVLAGSVLGAVALPRVIARFEEPGGSQAPAPQPEPAQRGVPLDEPVDLMVNLKDEQGRRVLKATMVFEVKDEKAKAAVGERMTEIRHRLIALLSDKRLDEVEGKEQKDLLLRLIRMTANECVGIPDAILHVYFTQFIIQ
ncbi:MAG: flagellar basal body-associated FliL family protein [Planctomycetota bacterium]